MLGLRLEQLANELGTTQKRLTDLLQIDKSTPSNWRSRAKEGKDPDFRSLVHVATTFHLSADWLLGRCEEPRWSPDVLAAQNKLRRMVMEQPDLNDSRPWQRLIRIWEMWRELVPTFTLEIWTLYLRWDLDDWERCLSGIRAPQALQYEAVEALTGLPQRWLRDGDTACLREMQMEAYRKAFELMVAENLDPEDVIRIARQQETLRG